MDSKSGTFFENNVSVEKPQSKEEDEEIEEQKRLQEELEDLLTDGIRPFRYDDSTINSSNMSSSSIEDPLPNPITMNNKNLQLNDSSKNSVDVPEVIFKNLEQDYRDAMPKEQLKVLYEIRMREIESLRVEHKQYQIDKENEIKILKNKVTLSEAELRHSQMSMSNLESLLVEKTEAIRNLSKDVKDKNNEIESLQTIIEKLNIEICSYQSTVNELQLKQCESNPFNKSNRIFQSEEIQRVHQEQVIRLETMLEEQKHKVEILEKERNRLQEDLKRIVKSKNQLEEESNLTILGLTKKLQSTQQQCKDLFNLGEAIKKESDHFKERLSQLNDNKNQNLDTSDVSQLDNATLSLHVEKLKKMLLDKEIQLNTLLTKQKFYENDINELFEYREMLNSARKNSIKSCNVEEHTEQLLILQQQLDNYQMIIEDRNKEIMNLHLINKESQEKIEEMLRQTRTDIQNLSNRYSLPQLEKMSRDLQDAETTIHTLKQQLNEKIFSEQSLKTDLNTAQKQVDNLQRKVEEEKQNFDAMLLMIKSNLKQSEDEVNRLRKTVEDLEKSEKYLKEEKERIEIQLRETLLKINEPEFTKEQSKNFELTSLESQYREVKEQLDMVMSELERGKLRDNICNENIRKLLKLKAKIQKLLVSFDDVTKSEIEQYVKEYDDMLTNLIESFKNLNVSDNRNKSNIEILQEETKDLEMYITDLAKTNNELSRLKVDNKKIRCDFEDVCATLQQTNEDLGVYRERINQLEQNKLDLLHEISSLKRRLSEIPQQERDKNSRKSIKKNLLKEYNQLEEGSPSNKENPDANKEMFEAELLKMEISLQSKLQEENMKKLESIEAKYQKLLQENKVSYTKQLENWQQRELNYRKQLGLILAECSQKMIDLENENAELKVKTIHAIKEHNNIKIAALQEIENYKKRIEERDQMATKWENVMAPRINKYVEIEHLCKQRIDEIAITMKTKDNEVDQINKLFDDRIRSLKYKHHKH